MTAGLPEDRGVGGARGADPGAGGARGTDPGAGGEAACRAVTEDEGMTSPPGTGEAAEPREPRGDRSAPDRDPRPRRRRRATGGVAPTREVADVPLRDAAEDWRDGGTDDDRLIREVPPHW